MTAQIIDTTWGDVRVGDLMHRGLVVKVGRPMRSRAGRMLLTITYENGDKLIKEADMECTLIRETE
jgi:hypothetical protein